MGIERTIKGVRLPFTVRPARAPGAGRMFLAIHFAAPIGFWAHLVFIPIFLWLGVPLLALFNVGSVLCFHVARRANLRGRSGVAMLLMAGEVIVHAILAIMLVGWESGFHYYLIVVVPFLLFDDRHDSRLIVAAATLVTLLYPALWLLAPSNPLGLEAGVLRWIVAMNIIVPLGGVGVICAYFRISSIELEERMRALAMTDSLTRLPNRRQMWSLLRAQATSALEEQSTFSLLLADIDRFKQVNDTVGHDGGDMVLQTVAARLAGALRDGDVVARWGGEEFLVLLPATLLTDALVVAERLRECIARDAIVWEERPLSVTLTLGVACAEPPLNVDACILEADAALYRGKSTGRNRVVATAPVGPAPSVAL